MAFIKDLKRSLCNVWKDFVEKHKFRSSSLYRHMALAAFESSVKFAIENLQNSKRFSNREYLIKYCLGQAPKGIYAEFGVYQAKSLNFIANNVPSVIVYGFDSFEGLPEDWGTVLPKGTFAVKELPVIANNVKLVKGWFKDTLPDFLAKNPDKFAFIHIDCDIYQSTKEVFQHIGDRITSGTVILFDELINIVGWEEHEFKAFQEFISEKKLNYKYIGYHSEQILGAGTEVAIQII